MCFVPRPPALFDLIQPDASAPAALASLLFDPPEPRNIGKNSVSRLFSGCLLSTDFLFSGSFSSLTFLTTVAASVRKWEV